MLPDTMKNTENSGDEQPEHIPQILAYFTSGIKKDKHDLMDAPVLP